MSVKPILFNTDGIRAILDGRKSVTRRVVKGLPTYYHLGKPIMDWDLSGCYQDENGNFCYDVQTNVDDYASFPLKPPYRPGEILWVRETWLPVRYRKPSRAIPNGWKEIDFLYRADGELANSNGTPVRWRPSIHMPREAARIFLRVTGVRVERLQEITMEDIRREGSVPSCAMCAFNEAKPVGIKCQKAIMRSIDCALENQFPDCGFRSTWDSTIKPADRERYGWAANPWVWVIAFERCGKPGDE